MGRALCGCGFVLYKKEKKKQEEFFLSGCQFYEINNNATMPGIDKLPIEEALEDSPQVK